MIASILLVVVVIILATIIFIWARSFIKEAIKKQELTAEQACAEIRFDASLTALDSNGDSVKDTAMVDVVNKANIPIYQFNIKKIGDGESMVEHVQLDSGFGLDPGRGTSFSVSVEHSVGGTPRAYQELLLVPEILGTSRKAKKIYTCPENYGLTLEV